MKVQKIFQAIEKELELVNTRIKEIDIKKFAQEDLIISSFPIASEQIPDYSRIHYDIKELESIPSIYFIEALYLSLLKRPPDAEGYYFYQQELLKGVSKAEIIARMAYSKEVRSKKIKVKGVLIPAMKFAISKIPIVSSIFGITYTLLMLPRLERELRGLRNQIDFKEHSIKIAVDRLTKDVNVRFERNRKATRDNFYAIKNQFKDLEQNEGQ